MEMINLLKYERSFERHQARHWVRRELKKILQFLGWIGIIHSLCSLALYFFQQDIGSIKKGLHNIAEKNQSIKKMQHSLLQFQEAEKWLAHKERTHQNMIALIQHLQRAFLPGISLNLLSNDAGSLELTGKAYSSALLATWLKRAHFSPGLLTQIKPFSMDESVSFTYKKIQHATNL